LDVDSTLITAEVIELIAEHAGTRAQVARITEAAMRGELDFAASLKERVATLAGLPESVFEQVLAQVEFSQGAPELIKAAQSAGWEVALVSGGFIEIVEPLATTLGITRFRANRLEAVDGLLTGRTVGPVIDAHAKAVALREFAAELGLPLEDTVAIGDGANDLEMMAIAGHSIAFNAKPVVRDRADFAIDGRLDAAAPLLGL